MDLFDTLNNGAGFSECGKHRLMLWRVWDDKKPYIMFIGLNPSTANADQDDPTIRRVKGIAKVLGFGGVYMMNLFTFISTDPKQLNIEEGNLPISDFYMDTIAEGAGVIVFAWGNFKTMGRDEEIKKRFPQAFALHKNKNGSPKHPLYVKKNVSLILY